jgi:hypothetical protein
MLLVDRRLRQSSGGLINVQESGKASGGSMSLSTSTSKTNAIRKRLEASSHQPLPSFGMSLSTSST